MERGRRAAAAGEGLPAGHRADQRRQAAGHRHRSVRGHRQRSVTGQSQVTITGHYHRSVTSEIAGHRHRSVRGHRQRSVRGHLAGHSEVRLQVTGSINAVRLQVTVTGQSEVRGQLEVSQAGAHPRGGPGGRAHPLGPKKYYICNVYSVKLRDFCLCKACTKAFCYVEGPRKSVAW